MSQFSEDKSGPSDPRQKSITNFVIVGDASGNNIHDSDSMKLKPKDDRFSHEIGDDIAACDPSSGYVHEDVSSSDQYADFCYSSCSIDKNATDMERNSVLLDSNQAEVRLYILLSVLIHYSFSESLSFGISTKKILYLIFPR